MPAGRKELPQQLEYTTLKKNPIQCKKGIVGCKDGTGKGRKGDLRWEAGGSRDGGDHLQMMIIIIINIIIRCSYDHMMIITI